MISEQPFFSVVLSTYGRGRHIRPTIESVLAQTFQNYELIVVGDGCSDETESIVRSFHSKRIQWLNLEENSGSQSFPNNRGIEAARGQWIAYLGHDDVWAPNHLESVSRIMDSFPETHFIISGCIFYGPPESEVFEITGLFDSEEAPLTHFFPPTSIIHRREVTERIGKWQNPRSLTMPVDCDLLLRGAHEGLRFVSTQEITAHKFAAGHRYLSYLRTSSEEQKNVLAQNLLHGASDIQKIILRSKEDGLFMASRYSDFDSFEKGFLFDQNRKNKGILRPQLSPLIKREVIRQSDDPRALDWHGLEGTSRSFRWSGPNPKPKILIPFSGKLARISIEIIAINPALQFTDLKLYLEDTFVATKVVKSFSGIRCLVADVQLKQNDYSILSLEAPTFQPCAMDRHCPDKRWLGVAVGNIVLKPMRSGTIMENTFKMIEMLRK